MNKELLLSIIQELLPLVGDPPGIDNLNPESSQYRVNTHHYVSIDERFLQKLIDGLQKQDELVALDGTNAFSSPNGGRTLRIWDFAHWILAQCRFRNPLQVLEQLEDIIMSNKVLCTEVLVLWGLHPTEPINLTDEIDLVPLASLPSSQPKDELIGLNKYLHPIDLSLILRPRPKAALVHRFDHTPIFNPRHTDKKQIEHISREEVMRDIGLSLILLEDRPIFPIAHWYEVNEDVPIIGGVRGWGGKKLDWAFITQVDPKSYDKDIFRMHVQSYLELEKPFRNKLRIPLERLNSAKLWLATGETLNAAIELGIAIEALLTNDLESDAPISYTVRIRGAFFLGGNSDDRKLVYKQLKLLYTLRSLAAHNGYLPERVKIPINNDEKVEKSTSEFLALGCEICKRLISELMLAKRFPNWESLILG